MQLKNNVIFAILASMTLGAGAFWLYQNHSENQREAKQRNVANHLVMAKELLQRSHPQLALDLLKKSKEDALYHSPFAEQWADLGLQVTRYINNEELLESLFKASPDQVIQNQELSYRLAEGALLQNKHAIYEPLLNKWYPQKGGDNTEWQDKWFLLKADSMALEGEAEKAVSLLQSKKLKGDAEIARLVRLGILNENEHPKIAFKYLTQALQLKPHDGDLHYFRAKVLEDAAKNDPALKELALTEFQQAIKKKPSDHFYKNELIDAYLSTGDFESAYKFLAEVSPLSLQAINDELQANAIFVSQVFKPLPAAIARHVRYPENPEKFEELVWLEVLERLKMGQDKQALTLLETHPNISQYNPPLYAGLMIVIGSRYPELETHADQHLASKNGPLHPLFKQLQNPSKETAAVLKSPEGYAALFLAAGWLEAALQLHVLKNYPDSFPNWVAYGLTQSLSLNRDVDQAIDFAVQQKASPQLNLLIGELYVQKGNVEGAIQKLTPLAKGNNDVGVKSVALLSKLYASQGMLAKAKHIAEENGTFAASLAGQEAIARLALKMENTKEAEEIYNRILSKSSEAKSYFALKAYKGQDYQVALQLTKELLQQYPKNQDLENQLAMIEQAAKKNKKTIITP